MNQIFKSQKGTPKTYTTIIKIEKVNTRKFDWGEIKFIKAKSYPFTDDKEKAQEYSYKFREKDEENGMHWMDFLQEGNIMSVFVVEKTQNNKTYKNIYPALKAFKPLTEEDL